jgi:hypothetical protein
MLASARRSTHCEAHEAEKHSWEQKNDPWIPSSWHLGHTIDAGLPHPGVEHTPSEAVAISSASFRHRHSARASGGKAHGQLTGPGWTDFELRLEGLCGGEK